MQPKKSYFYPTVIATFLVIVAAVAVVTIFGPANQVKAALGFQYDSTNKLLATTSPFYASRVATSSATYFYMTAGTGTTTFPLYTANVDAASLNIIFNASSTAAQLNWRYEYSTNGIDWYSDDQQLNLNATTTTEVRTYPEYNWIFASSTGGTSNSTTAFKHVNLPLIISPYTRVVFYVPVGAQPASIHVDALLKTNNTI